jgi:chloride channel 7
MSPAYKNNLNFKRAAAKMPAAGNEAKWPRKDNYFMGKQSLSYQEDQAKIWRNRVPDKYEVYFEWLAYGVLGIVIGLTAYIMDLIEESLVHFKDHYT